MIKRALDPLDLINRQLDPMGAGSFRRARGSAGPAAFPITSVGLDASLGGYGTSWNYIYDFQETSGVLVDEIAGLTTTNESGGTKVYSRPGSIANKSMIQVGERTGGTTLNGFIASPSDVIGTQGYVFLGSYRCTNNIVTAAGIGTYGVSGDANFAGNLFYIASATSFKIFFYDTSGFAVELEVTGAWNDGNIHDFMVVRDAGVGVYLFTDLGNASNTVHGFKNTNITHAQRLSFGRPSTWFSAGAQRGTAWQYFAMSIGNATAALCRANGATMLSNWRALRTDKRAIPVQSVDIKSRIGGYGSDAWKHILRFQETSGNVTAEDSLEVATATGVSGADVITYSRTGPITGHSAIALRDNAAGVSTAARFVFANALIEPSSGDLAVLAVVKVAAADTTTRPFMGMDYGADYVQVKTSGTAGIVSAQVFDGALSNAATGAVDSDDQWLVVLMIFDNTNNAIYLNTQLESLSATGVALGAVNSASKGWIIGSADGHQTQDFAFFASTTDITGLVANRVAIVSNFATALGL